MGWAERLNPNSEWNRRKNEKEAAEKHIENTKKISQTTIDWLYGRRTDGIA
jgi:hypothetical protein